MVLPERLQRAFRAVDSATERLIEAASRGNAETIAKEIDSRGRALDELGRVLRAGRPAEPESPEVREARRHLEERAVRAEEELRRLAADSRTALEALRRGTRAARSYREEPLAAVVLDRSG